MKIKLLVGALVVLVVMNVAAIGTFVYVQTRDSQRAQDWRGPGFRGDQQRIASRLKPQERRRLFNAMRDFREETRPLAEDTRALEDDLMAAMRENPVLRARVDSLLEQISANRLEIARRATDRMIAMGDSLTPDERAHLLDALVRMRRGGPPDEGRRPWRGRRQR